MDKWCSDGVRNAALVEFFGLCWAGYSNPYLTAIGYVSFVVFILTAAYLTIVIATMLLHQRVSHSK